MSYLCFWSAARGSVYGHMLQALVSSYISAGMRFPFHVFSDKHIAGAINHRIPDSVTSSGLQFKIDLLAHAGQLPCDTIVWLDSDMMFVRPFSTAFVGLIQRHPMFVLLEDDLTAPALRGVTCWGLRQPAVCALAEVLGLCRLFHLNSGFYGFGREALPRIITLTAELATLVPRYQEPGTPFNDEPLIALAAQVLSPNGLPSLYEHSDSYAIDIIGSPWPNKRYGVDYGLGGGLPGSASWIARKKFKCEDFRVNPALVHLIHSKSTLAQLGQVATRARNVSTTSPTQQDSNQRPHCD